MGDSRYIHNIYISYIYVYIYIYIYIYIYTYKSRLDRACFQYDMVFGNFKRLPIRTAFVKILLIT